MFSTAPCDGLPCASRHPLVTTIGPHRRGADLRGGKQLGNAWNGLRGSPVPFDPAEIDKKLAAAHTLNTLAKTTNRVVFDLYDHCALVVRFFIVESNGQPIAVDVRGDQALVSNRSAHRSRAISSGDVEEVTLDRPARFHLVAAPLHDGDRVQGVIEFVVPSEMVEPKRERLAIVSRATSAALRAWHAATVARHETSQVAGTSFALGVRLAGVVIEAGELGAATRLTVQFLAKEFKTPVVSWRADASGEALRIGPSSGLAAATGPLSRKAPRPCTSRSIVRHRSENSVIAPRWYSAVM